MTKQKKGVIYFTHKQLTELGPDNISLIDEEETKAIEKASGVSFYKLKLVRYYDMKNDRLVIAWEVA